MNKFWWRENRELDWQVPIFVEFGLKADAMGLAVTSEDWLAAREQLWSIREGLS